MKTLAILLCFLVVVCVFIAQHPADAACDFQSCWVLCQRQYNIYFRKAYCEKSRCICVYNYGG
uniref:Termicin n=1 Tax=Nasutitermes walkeri TaxID=76108 RepID=Q5SDI2_9NEOP|nr:termicin [Nasutitermes walkeri]